jgi:DNA-binding transcriptional LysR family regulator
MVTGCEIAPLFDGIAQFGAAHPGVAMQLVEGSADQLAADVRSGALDAALLGTAERELPGLESATIVSEELAVAVAPGHPLLECDPLTLADVVAHPVICLPTGTGIRTVLDLACGARGLAAAVALQASAPGAVADLAARGLGVAVLTASMLAGRDGLRVRPIADTGERALLALVWRPDPGPAVSELIERCRAAFGAARQPG